MPTEKNAQTGEVVYIEPSISPPADSVEWKILDVCESVKIYVEREINAAGMILVDRLARKTPPSEKALAVEQWVNSVYIEAENRKAQIYADVWPDSADYCDFSMFGKKPHTVSELMMEA